MDLFRLRESGAFFNLFGRRGVELLRERRIGDIISLTRSWFARRFLLNLMNLSTVAATSMMSSLPAPKLKERPSPYTVSASWVRVCKLKFRILPRLVNLVHPVSRQSCESLFFKMCRCSDETLHLNEWAFETNFHSKFLLA